MGKTILKSILILIVVTVMVSFVRESQLDNQRLELKQIQIKDTSAELKLLKQKYDEELNKTQVNEQKLQDLQKQLEEKDKQLQAKKEQQAKLAQKNQNVARAAPSHAPQGSCSDWMAQAGITDQATAYTLIMKESGCRNTAQNPRSTAYGIMQFLDGTWRGVGCTKTSDPVEQLRCGQKYINARYGSWANALAFHRANNWY